MNLDKLKELARRHELREEWRKAIETYERAARDLTAAGEPVDPALYNRIGDLEIKAGNSWAALDGYRLAAALYAEQGFFNNAIALCGKILRVDPGQVAVYLRLAELHARKHVVAEAKRNLAQYVERMVAAGRADEALKELRSFGARFAASQELLTAAADLAARLPGGEGGEGLPEFTGEARAGPTAPGAAPPAGGADRRPGGVAPIPGLVFIDTGIDVPGYERLVAAGPEGEEPVRGDQAPPEATEGGFARLAELGLDLPLEAGGPAHLPASPPQPLPPLPPPTPRAVPPTGFEPTVLEYDALPPSAAAVPPLLEPLPIEPLDIPGLETRAEFAPPKADDLKGLGVSLTLTPEIEGLFDQLDVEAEAAPRRGSGRGAAAAAELTAGDLERLERDLAHSESAGRLESALARARELARRCPEHLPWYQKRVELAVRLGEPGELVEAYLALAEALVRKGARAKALAVYEHVLDYEADNRTARAALAALGPEAVPTETTGTGPAGAAPEEEFVDLGALILDRPDQGGTRMRVEQTAPVGDEDRDFQETLAQFKDAIASNLEAGDTQTHYDLGVAFKEMGLLNEAIAQFQQALRGPEGRLKSSEALGAAFYEMGRHGVAEAVLTRAIEALPGADDEKVALLYWLGRAIEAQGRGGEAVRWYERAMAVDITFLDVSDRLARLAAGGPP